MGESDDVVRIKDRTKLDAELRKYNRVIVGFYVNGDTCRGTMDTVEQAMEGTDVHFYMIFGSRPKWMADIRRTEPVRRTSRQVPWFIYFKDGEPVYSEQGSVTKGHVLDNIEKYF